MTDKPRSIATTLAPERLSRRHFLRQALLGTTIAGAAAAVTGTAGAADLDPQDIDYYRRRRVSKYTADYQWHPHRGQHCGICEHFREPDSCEIVRGEISSRGWCHFYEYDEDEDEDRDRY